MQSSKLLRSYALVRRAAAIGCAAAIVILASNARAASTTASRPWGTVVWEDRAGACGDAARVSALVEQSLTTPTDRDPLFVRAEVESARVGRRRASLFLRRGAAIATRDIDAASCEELARAAAVVVAMAHEMGLDPSPSSSESTAAPPVDAAKDETALDSPPPATPDVAPHSIASEREVKPIRIEDLSQTALSVAPVIDAFTLPGLAPGIRARFARDFLLFGFALQGILLPGASRNLEGVRFTAGYAAGGLRIFRAFRHRAWEFDASIGLSLGHRWVEGEGAVVRRGDASPPYSSIESSLEAAYRVSSRFRLRTSIESVLHVNRPTYVAETTTGDRTFWSPSGIAFRASIGPELAF